MTEKEVIDELRRETIELRAALAEAMRWAWSGDPPPPDVRNQCEAAVLGMTTAELAATTHKGWDQSGA